MPSKKNEIVSNELHRQCLKLKAMGCEIREPELFKAETLRRRYEMDIFIGLFVYCLGLGIILFPTYLVYILFAAAVIKAIQSVWVRRKYKKFIGG